MRYALLIQPLESSRDEVDVFQKLVIYAFASFDPLEFFQNKGELFLQGFIDFGISLNHDAPTKTTAVAILLLGKAGEGDGDIDVFVFFR